MIKAIMAMNPLRTIGHENKLPWHCPEDLAHFKKLTNGGTVIMGRNTWESLPFRPLPGRLNIVVTSNFDAINGVGTTKSPVTMASSVGQALSIARQHERDIWIIGGAKIFEAALPMLDQIHLTILHNNNLDGDCKLPGFEDRFDLTDQEYLDQENGVIAYTYTKRDKKARQKYPEIS